MLFELPDILKLIILQFSDRIKSFLYIVRDVTCDHVWCDCDVFKYLSVTMNDVKAGFPKALQENKDSIIKNKII